MTVHTFLTQSDGVGRPPVPISTSWEVDAPTLRMPIDQKVFQSILELSDRARSGDWKDWLKQLSSHLLKTSPSPALRACANVTDTYHPFFMDLLNAAYLSVWRELSPPDQIATAGVIEAALTAPSIPPQIVQSLLNLAFHMEHYLEQATAEDRRAGTSAQQCTSWAKALHYKELELKEQPTAQIIQDLIRINNELHHDDANQGILTYLPSDASGPLPETYFEKLGQWDQALSLYNQKLRDKPDSFSGNLGKMRALHALGHWEELSTLAEGIWKLATLDMKRRIAPLAADAAWSLLQYDHISKYVSVLRSDSPNRAWLKAIVHVQKGQYDQAERQISKARDLLISELHTMLGESYSRAYSAIVRVQFLSEIEEIIMYQKAFKHHHFDRMEEMNQIWNKRLLGCERDVDIWQRALKLRAVVLGRAGPQDITIKYANLCRKAGRYTLAAKALEPFHINSGPFPFPPDVQYARLKLTWAQGDRISAFKGMQNVVQRLEEERLADQGRPSKSRDKLLSRCHLKVGMWTNFLRDNQVSLNMPDPLDSFWLATRFDACWPKAWHQWALINADIVASFEKESDGVLNAETFVNVVAAVQGFFLALQYAKGSTLQYSLRLLTLCFKFGNRPEVINTIKDHMDHVSQETWLLVIPQLLSRIDVKDTPVQSFVQTIIVRLGLEHPQSLVYPLTVAANSSNENRKRAARELSNQIRTVYPHLVDQAATVAKELIRVSVVWHEQWEMGLIEASRLDKEHNEGAMFETLDKLHNMIKRGPETEMEKQFSDHYLRHLNKAKEYIDRFRLSADPADLNKGWDAYVPILQRISHENKRLQKLELDRAAPALLALQNQQIEVAVPGTYQTGKPIVSIVNFSQVLDVFNSKHRPRKLIIKGSDGHDYAFLLKGHEDLRQDERVMQLIDLVNPLLLRDADSSKRHLTVKKYPIVPLSAHSGLIGWVENTDTLHGMILKHRQMKKVAVNLEHQLMLTMSGGEYDLLTLMQKIEVFEFALINTADAADDLGQAMWLRSPSAMYWFIKRCNYVRSVATMSMIGYILGLGDRHPLNILMERGTGRVVHIDLGDCWEVAMHRERYPEKVPFRLTRMIVGAMEASGTEGTFKISCNIVMKILRDYRESIEAVMEAFLVDPLVNWKLVAPTMEERELSSVFSPGRHPSDRPRIDENHEHDAGTINIKAQEVINRITDKLTGRDFKTSHSLTVEEQVQKLIEQAVSYEHLCQCFLGWCPFCRFHPAP
ncbi:phosphatidylinositol 3-kinase tor2 [Atractiella rhizophila]|nr:phosphatidylinositol 3-kinase tor2 [Atractiella rhizophila]